MFRHHKYCVIEVSGLLMAMGDSNGHLDVYLLDAAAATNDASSTDDKGKIEITDIGFVEFVRRMPQRKGIHHFSCKARVAGTIATDDGKIQLTYVSQGVVYCKDSSKDSDYEGSHGGGVLLKYQPQ